MLWCNGRCNFAISNKCNLLWNYIQVIKNLLFFHFALSLWFISSKTFPFLFELFVKAHRENPSTRWIGSGENQQKHPFHKLIDDIFILMHSYCQKCIALNWMFGTFFIKKEVTIQFWQREKSFIRTLCNGWDFFCDVELLHHTCNLWTIFAPTPTISKSRFCQSNIA